ELEQHRVGEAGRLLEQGAGAGPHDGDVAAPSIDEAEDERRPSVGQPVDAMRAAASAGEGPDVLDVAREREGRGADRVHHRSHRTRPRSSSTTLETSLVVGARAGPSSPSSEMSGPSNPRAVRSGTNGA